jgi:hypothetical protein
MRHGLDLGRWFGPHDRNSDVGQQVVTLAATAMLHAANNRWCSLDSRVRIRPRECSQSGTGEWIGRRAGAL